MRLGVDVGGTFTDLVGLTEFGEVRVAKVPSVRHGLAGEVWNVIRSWREDDARAALVHGTTIATNALLERRGARIAFVTTQGFEDVLWLRRQDRSALYRLAEDHPPPLVSRDGVFGVVERVGASGVVTELSSAEVARAVEAVRDFAPDAVAIGLLFSFADPTHERALVAALSAALPDVPIVASHDVLPVFREYERFSTVSAEAYLRPMVTGYLGRMGSEAEREDMSELRVMSSGGGTLSVEQACGRAASLALSGPAGGVEGARGIGALLGLGDLLTLDMGGTSADASVILDGEPLLQGAGAVGGVPLSLPHVLIETVGAGGGSIAWVDAGGALRVGPQSAGADPGPACYGRGGEDATVTDAAVVLGWLSSDRPLASGLTLSADLAEHAVGCVADRAGLDPKRCAEGIVDVATASMVRALRRVSVERGIDPRALTLVAFGGAGPLFACRTAEALGMSRAVVPPHAGVLSALGLAAAPARLEAAASLHRSASTLTAKDLDAAFAPLEEQVGAALSGASLTRLADCRYPGQGYELSVGAKSPVHATQGFHAAHARRFGHADEGRDVELVNLRVLGTVRGVEWHLAERGAGTVPAPDRGRHAARALPAGAEVPGPCIIDAVDCTTRIDMGWRALVHPTGALILERRA